MRRLIFQFLHLALVLFGVLTILFVLLRLSGDPVQLLLPADAPPAEYTRLRHELGLDAPLYVQYGLFLQGLVRFDFGQSIIYREPALLIARSRLPATFELTAAAVVFAVGIGLPLGILAEVGRRPVYRFAAALAAGIGQSMPAYWLGVLLVLIFAVLLHLVPPSGRAGLRSLVLPAITLGMQLAAKIVLLGRSGMRQELRADYMRTARGKGLRAASIVVRHALPNMTIPLITVIGVDIGHLMGGAVITEAVFAWPGVGQQLLAAITSRDYPVVEAIVFFIAMFVVAVNASAEILYWVFDPRLRYE